MYGWLRANGFFIGMFLAILEGWRALLRSFSGAGCQLYRGQWGLQRRRNNIGKGVGLSLHSILRSGKPFQGGVWFRRFDRLWNLSGLLNHNLHPAVLRTMLRRQIICKRARIGMPYRGEMIALQAILFSSTFGPPSRHAWRTTPSSMGIGLC